MRRIVFIFLSFALLSVTIMFFYHDSKEKWRDLGIQNAEATSSCGVYNAQKGLECGGGTTPWYGLGFCGAPDLSRAFDTKCNYGNLPQVHPLEPKPGCPPPYVQECPNDLLHPCITSQTKYGTIKHCVGLPITCEQVCAGNAWIWDSVGKGCECSGSATGTEPPPPPPPPPPPQPPPQPPPGGGTCSPVTQGYCAPDQLAQYTQGTAWQGQETTASIICNAESGGNPYALNDSCLCGIAAGAKCPATGDYSVGPFQINLYAHCAGAFTNISDTQCQMANRAVLVQCLVDLGYSNFTVSANGILNLQGAGFDFSKYILRAIGIYTGAGNSWCPWSTAHTCGIGGC